MCSKLMKEFLGWQKPSWLKEGDPRRYPYHQMGFSRDQRGQHTPSLAPMEDYLPMGKLMETPIEAEDKITEPGFHPVWGRA